jgi:hypothetical protein
MASADFVIRTAGDRVLAQLSGTAVASVVTALMQDGPQSWRVQCGPDFHEARFEMLTPQASRARWARFASRAA